jgi:sulfatase modifying factor 1
MKIRSIRSIITAAVIPCAVSAALTATVSATITLDMIAIGNAGNAADTTTYGSVSYAYNIGKTEVTTAEYVAFLNATASTVDTYTLYNPLMTNMGGTGVGISQAGGGIANFTYSVTGGGENRPVAFVSWFDAARFSNWMTTGQGTTTETGSYTILGGVVSGSTVARNVVVGGYYIPTENEWYKAAYYNPGTTAYSLFPNGTDAITIADANYGGSLGVNTTTDVGTYSGDPSSYGTFDQGGNVREVMNFDADAAGGVILRGGSYVSGSSSLLSSASRVLSPTDLETISTGFRVSVVPEPSSALLAMLGGSLLLLRRKR